MPRVHSGTQYTYGSASLNKWVLTPSRQVAERAWKITGRRILWARPGSELHHFCSHSIA